jgi:RimJ/RimL family protein N-acetyltransferase
MSKTIGDLVLRRATIEDASLLLEWRNDRGTRNASHNTDEISRDDHLAWLERTLGDTTRQLFIAEERGSPVGTVRVDLDNGIHELAWTVAPNARGRGVARRMVAQVAAGIAGPIRAEVKVGNLASRRVAEHAGMQLQSESDGVLHYARGMV